MSNSTYTTSFTEEMLLLVGVLLSTLCHCLAIPCETLANKEGMLSLCFHRITTRSLLSRIYISVWKLKCKFDPTSFDLCLIIICLGNVQNIGFHNFKLIKIFYVHIVEGRNNK